MSDRPVILVCGHGRCGSSMVMQMLAATGLRCAGEFPSFEHEAVIPRMELQTVDDPDMPASWFDAYDAVKVLLPHRVFLPRDGSLRAIVVWLDRDAKQQARSQLKTIKRANPGYLAHQPDPRILSTISAVLEAERKQAIASLIPCPRIEMTFDDIVRYPLDAAESIRDFASDYGYALDAEEMSSVVVARSPECADGFEIERERGWEI